MRLLIVTQKADKDDPILGFFHGWIMEFAKHFESIIVICLEEGRHEFPANVKVLSLGKEKDPSKVRYAKKFYSYIWKERNDYDAVFVHMNPEYVILAGLLWRAMGKRISLWYTHKSVNAKLYLAEKLAHRIYSASKESFRLKSCKAIVMGHGIDTNLFRPIPSSAYAEAVRLITVGRISPVKDYETILRAVSSALRSGVDTRLTIAGGPVNLEDQEYMTILKRSVSDLELNEHVEFNGPLDQEEVAELLRDSDVFISASRTGSLDKAPLEAMASGLAVLSSNDAMRTILEPLGLYFEPGDAQKLAALIRECRTPSKRREMGQRLRKTVEEKHSLGDLISRMADNIKNP